MTDLDTTIKYLCWADDKARQLNRYSEPSTSTMLIKRELIKYIENALAAAKRL